MIDPPAGRITSPSPPSGHISFSYRYLAVTPKFTTGDCEPRWFDGLFERMKALCSLTPQEILSSRSGSLRAHPIEFSRTSEPRGFPHLNPQLQGYQPYQFQISRKAGRVHGFFIALVFHIVWFDPHHRLYP